jgi:hypothetical protein
MNRPWAALGLVLALCVFMPRDASAQGSISPSKPRMSQNYPNPFNPVTRVDFFVGGYPTCTEPGKSYQVTVRVLNSFTQPVAYPVLEGGSVGVPGATPLRSVSLPCGKYTAFWDGKNASNGREASSGIYFFQFIQDGVATSVRAVVGK